VISKGWLRAGQLWLCMPSPKNPHRPPSAAVICTDDKHVKNRAGGGGPKTFFSFSSQPINLCAP